MFNVLLIGSEDFMCDFAKENFFIWLEINGRFLSNERLFVKKRHLSLSLRVLWSVLFGTFKKRREKKVRSVYFKGKTHSSNPTDNHVDG